MSFPPEILNLFIDQLGLTLEEDPPSGTALLACTLVNRQFYHQASSYIFSSLSISARNTDGRSQRRLNALLDIIKANPNITRHIHSLTVEVQTCTASLPAVLRQLDHLQEFTWIDSQQRSLISSYFRPPPIVTSSIKNLCNVTALHFYGLMNLPLSLLSQCCHLESLTLIWVRFAEIERNTLSESLFSSLKKLEISGVITGRDVEAMRIIMIRAAHTLTTLILRDTYLDDGKYQNFSLASNINLSLHSFVPKSQFSCLPSPRIYQNVLHHISGRCSPSLHIQVPRLFRTDGQPDSDPIGIRRRRVFRVRTLRLMFHIRRGQRVVTHRQYPIHSKIPISQIP